jgi:aminoglycoside phosphotransferase (APT) family kinase protein
VQGWDNRTFRLGSSLSARLPSAAGYVPAVEKEWRVLPYLAARLSLPVPTPVALGVPGPGYPFPWSVRRWVDGATVLATPGLDRVALARDVAAFLVQLRGIPTADGPPAGAHSFHRGAHPSFYASEVEAALDALGDRVDAVACRAVWDAACATRWDGDPVWFHGDVAAGNLLVTAGRLGAVIDFGGCGVGDPACDLVFAWTDLMPEERVVFRDAVGLDPDTWARARGWVLWKTLIMLAGHLGPGDAVGHGRVLREVLADPVA